MSNAASDTQIGPATMSGPVNLHAGIVDRTLDGFSRRFEWHPARLLQQKEPHEDPARAIKAQPTGLIILNQPITNVAALQRLFRNTSHHVCADGGANRLLEARSPDAPDRDGFIDDIDAIVGDLDSVSLDTLRYFSTLRSPKIPAVIHDPDQYSTDFQKSVCYTRYKWPVHDIAIWGGLGGRVDQAMSQLHHLYMFQQDADYREGQFYLFSAESVTFLLKPGMHRIHVRGSGLEDVFEKHVGIIPIGGLSFITTEGLEWDVTDWETKFGGQVSTSNHVLPETEVVAVKTTGDVLFTIALKLGVSREEAAGRPDLEGGNVVTMKCAELPRYRDRQQDK